jgi:hypothetical protein
MFVTLKVFKLIGPSNDGRRHGRGTYLFVQEPNSDRLIPITALIYFICPLTLFVLWSILLFLSPAADLSCNSLDGATWICLELADVWSLYKHLFGAQGEAYSSSVGALMGRVYHFAW